MPAPSTSEFAGSVSLPADACAAALDPAAAPRRFPREAWFYLGPAFVASVAYMDPGNFATNLEGGARFGYQLLWVLLWSNAMAILVQYLAAKLGIATGKTLPENCREEFSRPTTLLSVVRCGNCAPWPPIWPNFWAPLSAFICSSAFPCFPRRCSPALVRDGDPADRASRLSVARARDHGVRGVHRHLLRHRDVSQQTGLASDRVSHSGSGNSFVVDLPGGFHAGRHGDAARDLSALRAGAAAPRRPKTATSITTARWSCSTCCWP